MVRSKLFVIFAEPREPNFAVIANAIVVGVSEIGDLAGERRDHSVAKRHQTGRKNQLIGEHDRGLEVAVAVFVGQSFDLARRFSAIDGTSRIISHFYNPHPAKMVEGSGHGIDHLRFGGGEFDFQPRQQLNRADCLVGRQRRVAKRLSEQVAAQRNANEEADDNLVEPSGHLISVGQGGGKDDLQLVSTHILTDQIAAA